MSNSEWLSTRMTQIAALSEFDGGGKDKTKIDSNAEFACLSRLLANCTEENDKKLVSEKMYDYLNSSKKEHFEWDDGTSYDEIIDSTGNRMYIGYDTKGDISNIGTTYKDKNGVEHSTKEPLAVPEEPSSEKEVAKAQNVEKEPKKDEKGFIGKYFDNVKQFYSDLHNKGIKEAYTDYWGKLLDNYI